MRALLRFVGVTCVLAILSLLATARSASAEAPSPRATPVHVLGIDSDDAEDQADALTGALRSRVRSAPGWSLQETQHSLGMLTAALRCPSKPDAACAQKIGDQLHTDRFVWGVLTKAPGNQVAAEIHLWSRGRPDISTKETYSDNLKDQNDETLRRIATRILERISGTATSGSVTVHAGEADGMVWIDGKARKPLERGTTTIDLPPGTYRVEVRAQGFATALQPSVVVAAGQDTSVPLKLQPEAPAETTPVATGPAVNVRRVVGWSLIGVGAVAAIIAGVEGAQFLSDKSDLDNDRKQIPANVVDVCAEPFSAAATAACSKFNEAKDARTIGVLVGSAAVVALAAGVVLLLTDHPKEGSSAGGTSTARAGAPSFGLLRVLPYASPRGGGGVDLALTF